MGNDCSDCIHLDEDTEISDFSHLKVNSGPYLISGPMPPLSPQIRRVI